MNACLAPRKMLGFTLMEMIVVIVITGIIASVVAVFIRSPIQGYLDTVRRSEMTDTADNALRRIGRDLRLALPNSVRVQTVGNLRGLEFLLTRSGGRYRAGCVDAVNGDPLTFGDASAYPCETIAKASTFDVLGPPVAVNVNDAIAIFNLGIPGADAYAGDTLRTYNGAGGSVSSIGYTGGQFPFASPGNRFQVVQGTVSYVCDPLPGTGQLNRYAGYARTAAQTVPPAGGAATLLAENVSGCEFTYDPSVLAQRAGLVTMTLTIRRANMAGSNESVTLYHTVHVSNVP